MMITWAKHDVITSMTTKRPKSEQVEPPKAIKWDITLLIALQLITKMPKSVASAVSLLEPQLIVCLILERSEKTNA